MERVQLSLQCVPIVSSCFNRAVVSVPSLCHLPALQPDETIVHALQFGRKTLNLRL
jgi:hypothetical protein